jgi:hypothetical protein
VFGTTSVIIAALTISSFLGSCSGALTSACGNSSLATSGSFQSVSISFSVTYLSFTNSGSFQVNVSVSCSIMNETL